MKLKLNNIKLFIHDEKNLFNNILKVSEIINGVLDLQLDDIEKYDINILNEEFEKILTLLEEFKDLKILQLNSFNLKAKFTFFGIDSSNCMKEFLCGYKRNSSASNTYTQSYSCALMLDRITAEDTS